MENITKSKIITKDGKKIVVKVDRVLCIGAASCVAIAPKTFTLDEEAKAVVLPTAVEDTYQTILDSAKSCPVAAIIIEEESGKQVFP